MRRARLPRLARVGTRSRYAFYAQLASAILALTCAVLASSGVLAQSLSQSTPRLPSSFPKSSTALIGPVRKIDSAQPLYLQGDELIYDTRGSRVTARGNVEIYYDNNVLTADEVVYDQSAGTLTANGNVMLKEPGGAITRGERITLTDDFRDGFVQQLSVVARDDTKIAAERAQRRDGNVTEFQNGKFTPCKSDAGWPPLWCIGASRIVHDQAEASITYQDAWFQLYGVPIFYLPYFQHADPSVKRRSGFLMPEYSNSDTLGFGIGVPYYFALAPNYDFTFNPTYLSKHGVLWQGEWRHRLALGGITGAYTIKFAGIDEGSDDANLVRADLQDEWRGSVETRGQFSLSSWWSFGWDITLESDDTFRRFYKLDSILQTDRVNSVYLRGQSERNYFSITGYHFGGLLFNDTPQSESRVHPIVDWNYIVGQPVLGGELSTNVNALSFSRSDAINNTQRSDINRAIAEVNWRRRLTDAIGISYTPFGNLRGDAYQFNDVLDPVTGLPIENESVTRGVASAGVLTAYPWVARSAAATHVVEPVGQIIARTASVDQRRLPDEDAKSVVFDDTNLFDLDKMSGYDRIETGTRANVGVQYSFQSDRGAYARLLAGQSFHISGDNIYRNPGTETYNNETSFIYSPRSGLETDRSDYVLGAYFSPFANLRTIGQARFDEHDLSVRRADLYANLSYGPFSAAAVYAFTAADPALGVTLDQSDIYGSLGVRLTDRWSVGGTMRFDIDAGERLSDSLQVKYADECFVLTATFTETFITDPTRDIVPDRAVMLRFELKHLGEYTYRTDALDYVFAENQPAR